MLRSVGVIILVSVFFGLLLLERLLLSSSSCIRLGELMEMMVLWKTFRDTASP